MFVLQVATPCFERSAEMCYVLSVKGCLRCCSRGEPARYQWRALRLTISDSHVLAVCFTLRSRSSLFFFCSLQKPRSGLLKAVQCVMQISRGGLATFGPPCGSWTWLNRATSGRNEFDAFGFEGKAYVREANRSSRCIGTNSKPACVSAVCLCCVDA